MSAPDFWTVKKVFIVSAGRTGTKFFGENMSKLSGALYSIHEPDRLSIRRDRIGNNFQKIKKIGFSNAVIKKFLGTRGSRNLSLNNISGKLPRGIIQTRLLEDRKWVPSEIDLYVEANYQLFGVIEVLLNLKNSKVILFSRDPRDWVASWMNKGSWYDRKDLLTQIDLLGLKRLTPKNIGQKLPQWDNYSRFQKLCWAWTAMNGIFYNLCNANYSNLTYFFFEDIFVNKDITEIQRLLGFLMGKMYNESVLENFMELLEKKINTNPDTSFPPWTYWDPKTCIDLEDICGDLMRKLGYGKENYWFKKLGKL